MIVKACLRPKLAFEVLGRAGSGWREAGFTLVELLVSVALLALLTMLLLEGLRLGTARFTRDPERLERWSRIAVAQDALRTRLADARPLLPPGGGNPYLLFDGRPDQITFIAPAPRSVPRGGLEALAISYVRGDVDADGGLLLRAAAFDLTAGAGDVRTTTLLDHVRRAAFSYFGTSSSEATPRWHAAWQDPIQLPTLVRLSIDFSDGSRTPDVIVALRLSPHQRTIAGDAP
jgi:general secretion pathway protein J